jgi:hypothetical protein
VALDPSVPAAPSAEETPVPKGIEGLVAAPAAVFVEGAAPFDETPVPRGTDGVVAVKLLDVYEAKIAELADSASVTGQMV